MSDKQNTSRLGWLISLVISIMIIIPGAIVFKNRVVTLTSTTLKDAVVIECTYRNTRGRRRSGGYTSSYTPVAITKQGEKAKGTLYVSPKSRCTRMIGLNTSIYVNSEDQKLNRIGSFFQFWFFPYLILLAVVFVVLIATKKSRPSLILLLILLIAGALLLAREFGIFGLNQAANKLATPEGQFGACVTKHLIKADLDGRSQLRKLECIPMPDITVLSEFPNLEEVFIWNESFTSIQQLPLSASLRELRIRNPKLTSLVGLDRFTQLESLSFSEVQFESLNQIPANLPLKKLKVLSNSRLENLQGIGRFKNLKNLELESNSVSDISEIHQLLKLETLYIGREPVVDLSPLQNLALLEVARFRYSKTKDFSPLFNKPRMRHAGATGSEVPCEQMKKWMESLDPRRRKSMWLPDHCDYLKEE